MNLSFIHKTILAGLVLVFFSGCASWQEGWTAEYQAQFKEACLSGDGRLHADPDAYCDCVLQKVQKHYPTIADFMQMKDTAAYKADLQNCP